MKILGIVGSPRERDNCFLLVEKALQAAKKEKPSLQTEIIQFSKQKIKSCKGCKSCAEEPYICIQQDDLNKIYQSMKKADGIILACPGYGPFGACPSIMQAFLERLTNLNYLPSKKSQKSVFPLKDKICGLIVVSAEGEKTNLAVLRSLEKYALAYKLKPAQIKNPPFLGISGKGDGSSEVLNDKQALESAKYLGKQIAKAISPQLRLA